MGGYRLLASHWVALVLCALLVRAAVTVPRIEVLEGDGAINNVRQRRAKEPVVRVVDQDGHPLPNVAVTFLLPGRGPGGTFVDGSASLTVMTDSNGQAVARGLRPNNIAGQFQIRVTASYQGQATSTIVTQTNAEPAKVGGSSKTILILALVGGAAAAAAAVALGGKHGSSSSTPPPTTTGAVINPGNPTFGPPR